MGFSLYKKYHINGNNTILNKNTIPSIMLKFKGTSSFCTDDSSNMAKIIKERKIKI